MPNLEEASTDRDGNAIREDTASGDVLLQLTARTDMGARSRECVIGLVVFVGVCCSVLFIPQVPS